MKRIPCTLLATLTALCAHAADGGVAKPGEAETVQAAYDITMKQDGQVSSLVLIFTRDRLALLGPDSPETLIDPLQPNRDGDAIWAPYTSVPAKGTFEAKLDQASLTGSLKGETLFGTLLDHGAEIAISGTRSHKKYHIEKAIDPAVLLDQAREKKLAHRPKEAVDLYAKVIESDRYDTLHAGPALVDLVECFQLLKDDPAMAKRGQEALERYLGEPPPLDGAHAIVIDTAEEDLLWKPWPEAPGMPPKPLLVFTVANAEQKSQLQNGVTAKSTVITLDAKIPQGMRCLVGPAPHDTSKDCSATAILPDGSAIEAEQHWAYTNPGYGVHAQVSFDNLPAGTKKLAKLTGTVTVSQEQEWELKRIPLREGQTWETPEATCRLLSAKEEAGGWSITVVQTAKTAAESGTSSSSSSSGVSFDSPIWLTDEHGTRLLPHNVSDQGHGGSHTVTMAFAASSKPAALVHRIVTKTSIRALPFALAEVDLP